MKFVLIGIGSLGDVMPQISLASELTSRGHRAVVIGLQPYATTAASLGVEYVVVPADTSALWPPNPWWRRLALAQPGLMYATMLGRFQRSASLANDVIVAVANPGDVLVTGIVTAGAARLLGRELDALVVPILMAPLLPASSAASSALAPTVGGASAALAGSTVMWKLSERLAGAHTRDMARRLGARPVPPLGRSTALLATSPTLTPPSSSWPRWLHQTGWVSPREGSDGESLPDDLSAFLADGAPPVLMTFGTCPAVSPARDVEMFLAASRAAGRRAVLQTDAIAPGGVDSMAFNAPGVAHAALLPQTSSVVHHGGAGTTYASLAAGRPAMIVPHLGDQGYYARRVFSLGAGPRGIPRWRLTTAMLTQRLRSMTEGVRAHSFTNAATDIARALTQERGREAAVDALEKLSGA